MTFFALYVFLGLVAARMTRARYSPVREVTYRQHSNSCDQFKNSKFACNNYAGCQNHYTERWLRNRLMIFGALAAWPLYVLTIFLFAERIAPKRKQSVAQIVSLASPEEVQQIAQGLLNRYPVG